MEETVKVIESRHDIEHTHFEALMKYAGAEVVVTKGHERRIRRTLAYIGLVYAQISEAVKSREVELEKGVAEWSNVEPDDMPEAINSMMPDLTRGAAMRLIEVGKKCNELFKNEAPEGAVGGDILTNIAITSQPGISSSMAIITRMIGDFIYISGGLPHNKKVAEQDVEHLKGLIARLEEAGKLFMTRVDDLKEYANGNQLNPEVLELVFEDVGKFIMPEIAKEGKEYVLYSDVIGGGYDPDKYALDLEAYFRDADNGSQKCSFWDITPTGGAFSVDEAVKILGAKSSLLATMLDIFAEIEMGGSDTNAIKLPAQLGPGEVVVTVLDGGGMSASCRGIELVRMGESSIIEAKFDLKFSEHIFENVVNILWFASIFGLVGLKHIDYGNNWGKLQVEDANEGRTIDVEFGGEKSEFSFIFVPLTDDDTLIVSFGVTNPIKHLKSAAEAGVGIEKAMYQWGHARLMEVNVAELSKTAKYIYTTAPYSTSMSMSYFKNGRMGQLYITKDGVPLKLSSISVIDPDKKAENVEQVQEQAQ